MKRLAEALALFLLAGCGAPEPGWVADSSHTPRPFAPGVVSTPEREYGLALSADGTEAYFTRRGRRGPAMIFVTRFVDGAWREPEPAPFALEGDEAPHLVGDGGQMLFVSRRPVPGTVDRSQNIWSTRRGPDGWSPPEPIRGTVNQPESVADDVETGAEVGPALFPDGSLLYATRVDAEWGMDLYVARPDGGGGWIEPRPLRINSYGDETSPALSPDGAFLVFQAFRATDGPGDQDLYVSERTDYGWSAPRPLPEPINSVGADGWPSFSPDGRLFFFASDRDDRGGYYDVYVVDAAALGLEHGASEPR